MKAFARVIISLLFGGAFYFVWLGIFMLSSKSVGSTVGFIEFVLAPVATAAGFATGIVLFERLTRKRKTKFFHIFIWPLIGCAIGAGAVYWFGPMLIVFTMLLAGTASIAIREVVLNIKKGKS